LSHNLPIEFRDDSNVRWKEKLEEMVVQKGFLEMKKAGAKTIAQDETTCVVFGMPKTAIELGAVDKVVPLQKIPAEALQMIQD